MQGGQAFAFLHNTVEISGEHFRTYVAVNQFADGLVMMFDGLSATDAFLGHE